MAMSEDDINFNLGNALPGRDILGDQMGQRANVSQVNTGQGAEIVQRGMNERKLDRNTQGPSPMTYEGFNSMLQKNQPPPQYENTDFSDTAQVQELNQNNQMNDEQLQKFINYSLNKGA